MPTVANYMGIDIGSNAAPQLIDLNRDGKLDLVIGKKNGFIDYFQNTGTTSIASFSSTPTIDSLGHVDVSISTVNGYACPFIYDDSGAYKLLVGNENGYIFRYENIDGNLNGTFTLLDTVINREEGGRVCPSMGDINSDGLFDLLVGNYAGGVSIFFRDNPLALVPPVLEAGPGIEVYPNPASEQAILQIGRVHV